MTRLLFTAVLFGFVVAVVVLLTHSIGPFDQPLQPTSETIAKLRKMGEEPKFIDLPGEPAARERARMEPLLNELLDELSSGIERNPRRSWVIGSMRSTVRAFYLEDTEVRERCVAYLERCFELSELSESTVPSVAILSSSSSGANHVL